MWWWLLFILALGALTYWELVIAEGAHLGARVVIALYDLMAARYDRIKNFDPEFEDELIGEPLAHAINRSPRPRVLDMAGGTGRVAHALERQPHFGGVVTTLDLSARMLAAGAPPPRVRAPADRLPFAPATFDAVTCLEALEFFPDARAALRECLRVLRPGGVLLISNRIGWYARLIPGKTFSPADFRRLLAEFPLTDARIQPWQVEYDLVWAEKARDG